MNNSATATLEPKQQLDHDLDQLKSDLRQLRLDLADLAGSARAVTGDGVSHARQSIGHTARAVVARTRRTVESVEEQVSEHPFLAVSAALAVGALVGSAVTALACRRH